MDEAFVSFSEMVRALLPRPGEIEAPDEGVLSRIEVVEIETSIELDLSRDFNGAIRIGTAPPLHRVDTSYRPSYHAVRFLASRTDHPDAG
jgi:hypothetical protein